MDIIPIDPDRVGIFQIVSISPRAGRGGEQRTSADGVAQWTAQALQTPPPRDGFQPKAALVEVTLTMALPPTIDPLAEIGFIDLVARPWAMDGRSGVAFSATDVEQVTA